MERSFERSPLLNGRDCWDAVSLRIGECSALVVLTPLTTFPECHPSTINDLSGGGLCIRGVKSTQGEHAVMELKDCVPGLAG
jgi:hypothetical protein